MQLKNHLPKLLACYSPALTYYAASLAIALSGKQMKRDEKLKAVELADCNQGAILTLEFTPERVLLHSEGEADGSCYAEDIGDVIEALTGEDDTISIGDYEVSIASDGISVEDLDIDLSWNEVRALAACGPSKPNAAKAIQDLNEMDLEISDGDGGNHIPIPKRGHLRIGCQNIPWTIVQEIADLDPEKKKPAPKKKVKAKAKAPAKKKAAVRKGKK